MCGIHGWGGKDPKDFNIHKFNILGILNETRGKHSCGITYNGEIYTGTKDQSLWRDFCSVHTEEMEITVPAVIGHTRHATRGVHSASNAHPFGFGGKDFIHDFVGVHNGSLVNDSSLAKKYDVEERDRSVNPARLKIDSEILLEIIYKRGFEVLNYYNGAAALIFQDLSKPNVIYAYHGKSPTYARGTAVEERPLYGYQESPNSLYLCSLEESLEVINDTGGEIFELKHNIVYEITDGDFSTAVEHTVDRMARFQRDYERTTRTRSHNATQTPSSQGCAVSTVTQKSEQSNNNFPANDDQFNIFLEKPVIDPSQLKKGQVIYNKLRYWMDGKLCKGVFTPLKNNNMALMGVDLASAKKAYAAVADKYKFQKDPLWFYIWEGVMLDGEMDYDACLRNEFTDVNDLSHMTRYPIIDITKGAGFATQYTSIITDQFLPILGKRIYSIHNGCVIEARPRHKDHEKNLEFINSDDIPFYDMILGKDVEASEVSDEKMSEHDADFITQARDEIIQNLEDYITEDDMINKEENRSNFVGAISEIKDITEKNLNACLSKISKLQPSAVN